MKKDYEVLCGHLTDKLLSGFPDIDAEKLTAEVNRLFTPYLFVKRERDHLDIWASCCMKKIRLDDPPRTMTPEDAAILFGRHNEQAVCPCCGREATMKLTRYLGKRTKLREYKPVVFLNAKNGDLYARCYWALKDYQRELDATPRFMPTQMLHFSIGKCEAISFSSWDEKMIRTKLTGNYDPVHRIINEPFTEGTYYFRYLSYYIFGLDELQKSDYKYCRYEGFEYSKNDSSGNELYSDFCKYMAAYSIYPRQIEMLRKSGWGNSLVEQLIFSRKKNSKIIKWGEESPLKAFGLDRQELRAFTESGCGVEAIRIYKELKRAGLCTDFGVLKELGIELGSALPELIKLCQKRRITPEKALRYMRNFYGTRCYGAIYTIGAIWQTWKDYLSMAETLERDLTVERVLMPRDLDLAHNDAMTELNLEKARENKKIASNQRLGIARRRKKYNFQMGDWLIRIAESAEEVRAEGKTLEHCVGAYAERHMNGDVTILFFRAAADPGKSLYTIEMHGNSMEQMHGYKNEGIYSRRKGIAPDPRELHKEFLKTWIAWLKKGSPRNEDGSPRLPKQKGAKTA